MLLTKPTEPVSDTVPFSVLNQLPRLLRVGADAFNTMHEKTIFVFSALTACGGLLTNAHGVYYKRKVYPNLFFILSAPAASGKSSMTSAYDLLYPIHMEYLNKSIKAQEQFELLMNSKHGNAPIIKPRFQSVLIPGNISASRLVQHLHENEPDVPCVMVESELDTLTQANKSDFGGFSDILRKAFSNERVSLSRRGNNEFLEIKCPKLSAILSGTPKQLHKLMPSGEDGLFSRCMLYSFNPEVKWMDVSPGDDDEDINTYMTKISQDIYKFWNFFKRREVRFELCGSHWEQLNEFYSEKLDDIASVGGNAAISIVKRNAVVAFKLMMVLTALRAFESSEFEQIYECCDRDFKSAIALADLSLNSSLKILEQLPDGEPVMSRKIKRDQFKNSLPSSFTTNDALELGKMINAGTRTIFRWLDDWVKAGFLSRELYGIYKRV